MEFTSYYSRIFCSITIKICSGVIVVLKSMQLALGIPTPYCPSTNTSTPVEQNLLITNSDNFSYVKLCCYHYHTQVYGLEELQRSRRHRLSKKESGIVPHCNKLESIEILKELKNDYRMNKVKNTLLKDTSMHTEYVIAMLHLCVQIKKYIIWLVTFGLSYLIW